jgi:hypothetical protein
MLRSSNPSKTRGRASGPVHRIKQTSGGSCGENETPNGHEGSIQNERRDKAFPDRERIFWHT